MGSIFATPTPLIGLTGLARRAGWIARVRQQRTAGAFISISPPSNLTVEKVAANWAHAVDFSDPSKVSYPVATSSQMEQVVRNVPELMKRANMSRDEIKEKQEKPRKESDSKL